MKFSYFSNLLIINSCPEVFLCQHEAGLLQYLNYFQLILSVNPDQKPMFRLALDN